jgi:hypothetical protein
MLASAAMGAGPTAAELIARVALLQRLPIFFTLPFTDLPWQRAS